MVDIVDVSAVVAAAGVLVGVIYYILDLKNQKQVRQTEIETRQAELFMQIYNRYYTKETLGDENDILFEWKWKDFDDFWQKYGPEKNVEAFNKFDSLQTYFKGVGVLVRMNLIDLDLVRDLMGTSIVLHWEKSGSIIKEFRRRYWPHAYEGYEYLYDEIKKREQQLASKKA